MGMGWTTKIWGEKKSVCGALTHMERKLINVCSEDESIYEKVIIFMKNIILGIFGKEL